MITIFKNIEGREWDRFGQDRTFKDGKKRFETGEEMDERKGLIYFHFRATKTEVAIFSFYSLAELLANPSWCKAVWGEEYGYFAASNNGSYEWIGKLDIHAWKRYKTCSEKAFQILQQEGDKVCIEYIKKTMI